MLIFGILIYCGAFAGFTGWLANEKNRDFLTWGWFGLCFGPVALLTLIGAPSLKEKLDRDSGFNEGF